MHRSFVFAFSFLAMAATAAIETVTSNGVTYARHGSIDQRRQNVVVDVDLSGKQDKLPYETNAIPHSAVTGIVTSNDVSNIVTNEVPVGWSEWVRSPQMMPESEIIFHNGRWFFADVIDSIVYPLDVSNINATDQNATSLYFRAYEMSATRTPITRNALGLARLVDLPPLTNGLATAASVSAANTRAASAQATANAASNATASVAATVAAWETYWDGDEVRVTVTNYDSQVHLPSLYIEQKLENTNAYRTVWDERTRWKTNEVEMAELRSAMLELDYNKADRAWGNYDSTTGNYAPDGYTWVSSPKIAIAGGLAYQRTLTTAGAVWVLCSNGMVAETSGVSSNGFFRIKDDEGNTTFEIVRGNKRTVGANAAGITVTESGGVNTITIPYNVVSEAAPTLYGTTDLDGEWAQLSPSWLGQSGAWTGVVTSASAQYFIKAEYEIGGETYIKNNAPISVGGGIYCTDGIHKVRPVYDNGNVTWEVVQ